MSRASVPPPFGARRTIGRAGPAAALLFPLWAGGAGWEQMNGGGRLRGGGDGGSGGGGSADLAMLARAVSVWSAASIAAFPVSPWALEGARETAKAAMLAAL